MCVSVEACVVPSSNVTLLIVYRGVLMDVNVKREHIEFLSYFIFLKSLEVGVRYRKSRLYVNRKICTYEHGKLVW